MNPQQPVALAAGRSHRRRQLLRMAAGSLAAIAWFPLCVQAAAWQPSQPIRVIVPYAAGGTSDMVVRAIADRMQQRLGQPFVVDNRGGAATQIGTNAVVQARPDGHTILVVSNTITINPSLFDKLPYDVLTDLEPITYAGVSSHALVVNKDLPIKSVAELVAYEQANPGKLFYGSVGNGTSFHLGMEELKMRSGMKIDHVPYKGMGAMLTDVIGNSVQLALASTPNILQMAESGRLRVIGVTHPERLPELPDVPTLAEQGFPGVESNTTFIFFAPKGTPSAALDRLNSELVGALNEPDMRQMMAERGIIITGTDRAETAAFVRREIDKYAKIIQFSGAKVD